MKHYAFFECVTKGCHDNIKNMIYYSVMCLHSAEKRELVAFLFFFLVSRDCCMALPHDATGLSTVCNCGII